MPRFSADRVRGEQIRSSVEIRTVKFLSIILKSFSFTKNGERVFFEFNNILLDIFCQILYPRNWMPVESTCKIPKIQMYG
jgi:hypothetical protein